jgi:hypothetical protein
MAGVLVKGRQILKQGLVPSAKLSSGILGFFRETKSGASVATNN